MKTFSILLCILFVGITTNIHAQRIKLKEGSLDAVKNDTAYSFEFKYDNMSVGRYDKEAEYISAKTASLNEKQAGRGDAWAKNWVSNRAQEYEPKFIDLFNAFTGSNANSNSKYTIIIHTTATEPGYDVAGGITLGSSKSATINAEVTIVETANRSKIIAVITIDKAAGAPGATFSGTTKEDGTFRITAAYGTAGKDLAKFIKKSK